MSKKNLERYGLSHEILVHKSRMREAMEWCEEHLGKRWDVLDNRSGLWSCFWVGSRSGMPEYYKFCFQNSEDAILCSLKWS